MRSLEGILRNQLAAVLAAMTGLGRFVVRPIRLPVAFYLALIAPLALVTLIALLILLAFLDPAVYLD